MKTLSGNHISRVAIGTWGLGGTYCIAGQQAGIPHVPGHKPEAVLRYALNRGINLLDCSSTYGNAEETIGRAIRGCREKTFLATKSGIALNGSRDFSYRFMDSQLQQSCKSLKINAPDLFQAAIGDSDRLDEALANLDRIKKKGGTRYIGVSISNPEQAFSAIETGVCDWLQMCINLLDTQCWEVGHAAAKKGMHILVKSPLNKGVFGMYRSPDFENLDARAAYLTPAVIKKRVNEATSITTGAGLSDTDLCQTAIRFSLSIPFADAVLFGVRTRDHIGNLLKIAREGQGPFEKSMMEKLINLSRKNSTYRYGTPKQVRSSDELRMQGANNARPV
jgi:aryl-alcohol dehydrogenase-like predicted oxidoreductase